MTKRLTIALVALALVVLFAALPASARIQTSVTNVTTPGATVFIGEQGLNITTAQFAIATNASQIGWWASAAQITNTAPTKAISVMGRNSSFMVTPSDFVGYTGNWYLINPVTGFALQPALLNVQDPTMDVRIWDIDYPASASGADVTGGSVIQGDRLQFRVDTNIYQAYNGYRQDEGVFGLANNASFDGYIDIKVKTAAGNTLTGLWNASSSVGGAVQSITKQNVTFQPWFWGYAPGSVTFGGQGNWSTGATDQSGQQAYPAGTYTITAVSYLNAMYDNYLNGGAYYSDKTVTEARTVNVASNTVSITANQDTVVRSKSFSITITGRPNTYYYLWLKGTSSMDGSYDNQPPMLQQNQAGVNADNALNANFGFGSGGLGTVITTEGTALKAGSSAGAYKWQNGGAIYNDVAGGNGSVAYTANNNLALLNGTLEYGYIQLDQTGARTVGFTTTNWTKAQQYTVRVEQSFAGQIKSDEVKVNVQKGAVTIVAAGDQSYYLGEEVAFSGTNTESSDTYLFIVGPNLPANGGDLTSPHNAIDGTTTTKGNWIDASVAGDNTWSYKWGTSNLDIDAGTYTVYAVSQKATAASASLANVAYGTVSIIIKKPFVSATASQSTVAQGDELTVTGTAQGQPSAGVKIWILGKNFAFTTTQSVNSDSSFSYTVKKDTTKNLATGQYFVVVQHPMQNGVFDIDVVQGVNGLDVKNVVLGTPTGGTAGNTVIFHLTGAGSLQGSDAAEALVSAINDPNVDDTYTKLQFLVEVPVINVDPVGDRHVGDKFTITGTTNLAVGDDVLFEVYSSSFQPTQKSQSGAFSGATGTVKVVKGDGGLNKVSFDIDASTFKPDEYLVKASAVLQSATGTALFNVLEGAAPTAVPTAVVTTAAPTVVQTTVVVPPTTVATPVPTPTKTPGFGALVALTGLGAVAFVIMRRH